MYEKNTILCFMVITLIAMFCACGAQLDDTSDSKALQNESTMLVEFSGADESVASNESDELSNSDYPSEEVLFEKVISGDTTVVLGYDGTEMTFRDYIHKIHPEPKIMLDGIAEIDIDSDGEKEILVKINPAWFSIENILIGRYEGKIYVWKFLFRDLYNLNIDGSFSWHYQADNHSYGQDKLVFVDDNLKYISLWSVVQSLTDENDVHYYVEDKEVTREEYDEFIEKT